MSIVQPVDESGYPLQPCHRGALDGAAQSLAERWVKEQGAEKNNDSIQRNQPGADFDADDVSDEAGVIFHLSFLKIAVKGTKAKRKTRIGVMSRCHCHPSFPRIRIIILSDLRKLTADQPAQQALGRWNTSGIWSTAWHGRMQRSKQLKPIQRVHFVTDTDGWKEVSTRERWQSLLCFVQRPWAGIDQRRKIALKVLGS